MTESPGPASPRVEWITGTDDMPQALHRLGLSGPRPALVVAGGAAGMTTTHLDAIHRLVLVHLLPMLESCGAAIIDGGTRAGIMQVMGRTHRESGTSLPLIGVAAGGTVVPLGAEPGPERAELDPDHTHTIVVPGDAWGDEAPWISAVATALADGPDGPDGPDGHSVTLVINGGELTYADIRHSLAAGRPVVVVAGTGRTADAIATAASGFDPGDDRARELAVSDLVHVARLDDPSGAVSLVRQYLGC